MYSFSYTYSETGNLASFSHTSGATVVNYTYGHDAKHGIFEYVRMPKWFTSLFLDGGLHLANNVNSEAVESGSRSTYSYEYNQHGYPAVVNITPPKDSGNETVSRTVVSYFDITE